MDGQDLLRVIKKLETLHVSSISPPSFSLTSPFNSLHSLRLFHRCIHISSLDSPMPLPISSATRSSLPSPFHSPLWTPSRRRVLSSPHMPWSPPSRPHFPFVPFLPSLSLCLSHLFHPLYVFIFVYADLSLPSSSCVNNIRIWWSTVRLN
jgi:hypothetical protein